MSFGPDRDSAERLHDPVAGLRSAVDALLDQDPADLTVAEKGVDLIRLRRQMDRLDAAFAQRAQDANRNGVGVEDGHVSTPAWVAWKTGMHRSAVSKVLRTADVCELLPDTGLAWREGRVSTTAIEVITSARLPNCDEELAAMEPEFLDAATRGDRKRLENLTQHFKACARADGSKPILPDGLTLADVGDRGAMHGDLTKPSLQTIREAVEKFTAPPSLDDRVSLAQRQAEALVRICEIVLARGTDGEGARPVVSYITHARTESDVTEPLSLGLRSGVLDPRERDRILCDAIVVPVSTGPDGQILNVGRATSVWNRAQRRAVATRSPHCQWPGCTIPSDWCDIHHIVHWEHGGETSLENGEHLCRRHHSFVHVHRDWTFTFERQRFRAFRPDGTEVFAEPWHGFDFAA